MDQNAPKTRQALSQQLKWPENIENEINKIKAKLFRFPITEIVRCLEHKNIIFKCAGIRALADLKNKEHVLTLIRLLDKKNNKLIRLEAVIALGKIKDKNAVDPLLKLLYYEPFEIRVSTIKSLALIGSSTVIPNFINTLNDKDPRIRIATAEALVILGDKRSIIHLEGIRLDPDEKVRIAAKKCINLLKQDTDKPVVPQTVQAQPQIAQIPIQKPLPSPQALPEPDNVAGPALDQPPRKTVASAASPAIEKKLEQVDSGRPTIQHPTYEGISPGYYRKEVSEAGGESTYVDGSQMISQISSSKVDLSNVQLDGPLLRDNITPSFKQEEIVPVQQSSQTLEPEDELKEDIVESQTAVDESYTEEHISLQPDMITPDEDDLIEEDQEEVYPEYTDDDSDEYFDDDQDDYVDEDSLEDDEVIEDEEDSFKAYTNALKNIKKEMDSFVDELEELEIEFEDEIEKARLNTSRIIDKDKADSYAKAIDEGFEEDSDEFEEVKEIPEEEHEEFEEEDSDEFEEVKEIPEEEEHEEFEEEDSDEFEEVKEIPEEEEHEEFEEEDSDEFEEVEEIPEEEEHEEFEEEDSDEFEEVEEIPEEEDSDEFEEVEEIPEEENSDEFEEVEEIPEEEEHEEFEEEDSDEFEEVEEIPEEEEHEEFEEEDSDEFEEVEEIPEEEEHEEFEEEDSDEFEEVEEIPEEEEHEEFEEEDSDEFEEVEEIPEEELDELGKAYLDAKVSSDRPKIKMETYGMVATDDVIVAHEEASVVESVAKSGESLSKDEEQTYINMLQSKNLKDRKIAVKELHNAISVEALEALVQAATTDISWVRKEAIKSIANNPNKEKISHLITLLTDNKWYIREEAAKALGQTKSKNAIDPIANLLTDENKWVQETAIKALVEIDIDLSIDKIKTCLNSEHINVRSAAQSIVNKYKN
ncbi:MAG: HEAT repeat domain-containing protein [Cyanobacteriota bacterium]